MQRADSQMLRREAAQWLALSRAGGGVSGGEGSQAARALYALTQALAGAGFAPARDLPGLSTVRFDGQSMVLLGRVTPQVAARLALIIAGGIEGGSQ